MRKIKIISLMVASSMLLAACGKEAEETAAQTSVTETTATETTVAETEPTETEPTEIEPVVITPDNFFDTDPALSEWALSGEAGDIISLVDLQYIEDAVTAYEPDDPGEGRFDIYTAADLASLTYYVNVFPAARTSDVTDFFAKINLMADIDLSGYNWAPMGIHSADGTDYAFRGVLNGNGHTITGLSIDNGAEDNAFFGWVTSSTIFGLTIEGAEIHGADAAIFARHMDGANFFDCHADGQAVDNSSAGEALFSIESTGNDNRFLYCTLNVAGSDGVYYETEEPVYLNPYPVGQNNIYLGYIDPGNDGTFVYPDGDIFDIDLY